MTLISCRLGPECAFRTLSLVAFLIWFCAVPARTAAASPTPNGEGLDCAYCSEWEPIIPANPEFEFAREAPRWGELICYLVADNDGFIDSDDAITSVDDLFDEMAIGLTGTKHTEAIAFDPGTKILYGANAGIFGSIDVNTGVFTDIGPFGLGEGDLGVQKFADIDGLSFDPFSGIMYASVRRVELDLLIQVDLNTGAAVTNAFGPGKTYVPIPSINNLDDIDDIAVSSVDGTLFAIMNENGQMSRLITVDKLTGASADVTDLDVENVEGLGFHPDGRFLGVKGNGGKQLLEINPNDGSTSILVDLGVDGYKDYEGVACLTEEENRIEGSVYLRKKIDLELEKSASEVHINKDVSYELKLSFNTETLPAAPIPNIGDPRAGIKVDLYADNNQDGILDGGDSYLASDVTDGSGNYSFNLSGIGYFVVSVDITTIPFLAQFPVDNIETAVFVDFGETVSGLDFYFYVFDEATGILVSDTLPPGVTFISSSATQGSYDSNTGIWTVGTLAPGAIETLTIDVTQHLFSVENCAEIKHADQFDLDSTPDNGVPGEDDYACVTTECPPEIDLELEKSVDNPNPAPSGTLNYSLRVTNSADAYSPATGITVTDYLPTGVTFIETVPAGVLYDAVEHTVEWNVGSLEIGQYKELLISVSAPASGTHKNCAEVTDAVENDVDSTPGNGIENGEDDQDCSSFTVSPPDTGSIGDRVFNDLNADGIQDLGEPGLPGVLIRLYSGACGPTGSPIAARVSDPNGNYLFADLPAGDYCVDPVDTSVPVGYTLTTANDPLSVVLAHAQHYLDADFGYYVQPELLEADLELSKTVSSSSPAINDEVTFTITLSNQGPADATGVIVRDVIPVGLVYIGAQPSQGYYDTQNGFWGIGTLPVNHSVVLTIRVQVVIQNMIENIAQVIAVDQPDPDSFPDNADPTEDDQDNAIIEARGPGGVGDILRVECTDMGTVNALVFDASRDVLLAGTEAGKIHVSTDFGANWPHFLETTWNQPVRDLELSASGNAYAGTFGDGAYVSVDGGTTWSSIGPADGQINDLDVNDLNEWVYAASFGAVLVYDGVSWTELGAATNPFAGVQVIAIAYDSATGDVFASADVAGLFRYTAGAWVSAESGLPPGKVNALLDGPGQRILAGTNNEGVFEFSAGTWSSFGTGLENEPIQSLGSGPNGELLAGARESAAYFFNFITNTWVSIGNLPIYTVTSITGTTTGDVFAGAPGEGIYQIVDTDFDGIPDIAHQVANYLTTAVIQDLVVTPDGDIFAATYGYGVLHSSDGGHCWTRMNRGLENLWVYSIERRSDGVLFIGIWADGKGGIWRSDDDGRNWELVAFPNRQILSLAIDPNDEDIMYAGVNLSGTGSIYQTVDGGNSWVVLDSFTKPVWSVAISPYDSDDIYVGTMGDGVWKSDDFGFSFNQVGSPINGLLNDAVFELKFAPLASPYAGEPFAGTAQGVYRYDSFAELWELVGTGSESHDIRVLDFAGPNIFAGTWDAGILIYNPGTDTWDDFALPYTPVVAFVVHPGTQTLVIGTAGQGMYLSSDIALSTDVDPTNEHKRLPESFVLGQNYPNPFNPSTMIPFDIEQSDHVRIAIYDMLGRELDVLVDDVLSAGSYRISWDAGDRPSGTYLLRMESPRQRATAVLSLLK